MQDAPRITPCPWFDGEAEALDAAARSLSPAGGGMPLFLLRALVILTAFVTGATAAAEMPQPIRPEHLRWFAPPGNTALQGAWVIGREEQAGAYLLRVRLAAGGRIPPHTHPDERISTVLSGTIYVGFGDVFDEAAVVAVPAGGVYVAPANVAHYVWARDGEAVYQETGVGPTATVPARQPQ